MSMEDLDALFEHRLKEIYFTEKNQLSILDELAEEALDEELKITLEEHREETETHITRLEEVFKTIESTPKTHADESFNGILKERQAFHLQKPAEEIRELANMSTAIRIERHEISAYEELILFAKHLDMEDTAALLEQTLDEEHAMLERLQEHFEDLETEEEESEEEE